jgi:hypothetical protein
MCKKQTWKHDQLLEWQLQIYYIGINNSIVSVLFMDVFNKTEEASLVYTTKLILSVMKASLQKLTPAPKIIYNFSNWGKFLPRLPCDKWIRSLAYISW